MISFEVVEKHLRANPQIDSVEEFLHCLPERFRNSFTLVYGSRGAQRHCSSLTNPRIVFMYGAEFLLAVSNPSPDPRCNPKIVEMIQHHDGEARFEMRSISFPKVFKTDRPSEEIASVTGETSSGHRVVVSEANPALCLRCHGQDPAPRWGTYWLWPGVYGSLDDTILLKDAIRTGDEAPPESVGWDEFFNKYRHQGLYKALSWRNGRDIPNTGRPAPGRSQGYSHRPNYYFHLDLRDRNRERIYRILSEDKNYAYFKYAYLYASECYWPHSNMEAMIPLEVRSRVSYWPKDTYHLWTRYRNALHNGTYGGWKDFEDLNPFLADQLRRFERSLLTLETTLPRKYWGYLKYGDPKNPTNTELPRHANGVFAPLNKSVGWLDYLLKLQNKSIAPLITTPEGYAGTDLEFENYNGSPLSGYRLKFFNDFEAHERVAMKQFIERGKDGKGRDDHSQACGILRDIARAKLFEWHKAN